MAIRWTRKDCIEHITQLKNPFEKKEEGNRAMPTYDIKKMMGLRPTQGRPMPGGPMPGGRPMPGGPMPGGRT